MKCLEKCKRLEPINGRMPSIPTSDIRSSFIDCRGRRWRWVVDNRMRDYGDIDYERRVIRINRNMHRRDGELLIDTGAVSPSSWPPPS